MGKRVELEAKLEMRFVPLTPERESAWRAGVLLLLQCFYDAKKKAAQNEFMVIDHDCGVDAGVVALFPLADVDRQEVAATGGLYAWFVGHDGSAVRLAYGSG